MVRDGNHSLVAHLAQGDVVGRTPLRAGAGSKTGVKRKICLLLFLSSGERMIVSDIDGWSRGNHNIGVSPRHNSRPYFPLDCRTFGSEGA